LTRSACDRRLFFLLPLVFPGSWPFFGFGTLVKEASRAISSDFFRSTRDPWLPHERVLRVVIWVFPLDLTSFGRSCPQRRIRLLGPFLASATSDPTRLYLSHQLNMPRRRERLSVLPWRGHPPVRRPPVLTHLLSSTGRNINLRPRLPHPFQVPHEAIEATALSAEALRLRHSPL